MLVRCPSCQSTYRLDPARVPQHAVRVRCPRCTAVFRVAPPEPVAPAPSIPPPTPPSAPPAEGNDLGIEREAWHQPPRTRLADSHHPAHPLPPAPAGPASARALPKRPTWTGEVERTLDFGAPASKPPAPRLETAPFRPGAAPVAPPVAGGTPVEAASPVPPPPASVHPTSGFQAEPPAVRPPWPRSSTPAQAGAPPAVALPPARPAPEPAGPALTRARRLARVLVSDVLVYNQAARDRALQDGSLASVLAPEISKAWDLYKTKVGPEVATSTPYFKDALNEILAGGATVF